ncbi:MAG TPA: tetratricopeptide repeat protein [Phycisphaerae bacterium]|nr:tetratricopeptide repeat protein [Phycisphaerae bacterium]
MRARIVATAVVFSLVAYAERDRAIAAGPSTDADPTQSQAGENLRGRQALVAAHGFLNRGLYDLAIGEYRRFLEGKPAEVDAAVARYGIGVSLFRLNKLEEAANELAAIAEDDEFKFAAEVATMLGQCRLAAGEFDAAATSFQRVVEKSRKHALADDAASYLVEALCRAGKNEEAAAQCMEVLKQSAQAPHAARALYFGGIAEMRLEKHDRAAERFELLLSKHSDNNLARHGELLLAQCLDASGKPARAESRYRAVLEASATDYHPQACLGLASLLYRQGKLAEAADLLQPLSRGGQKAQSNSPATLLLARVRFEQGEYADALALFETGKSDGDEKKERQYWAAKCKLRLGDARAAAKNLESLLEASDELPFAAEATYDLAIAQHRLARPKSAARTLETLRSKYAEHPLAAQVLHLSAVVAHESKQFEKSRDFAAEFLEKYSKHSLEASMAFLVGENEFLLGRHEHSTAAFQAYLSKFANAPDAASARYRLGLSLYHQGQYADAMKALVALEKDTGDSQKFESLHLVLGDLRFRDEKWEAALNSLAIYLKGCPRPSCDDASLKMGLSASRLERHDAAIESFDRVLNEFPKSSVAEQARFERGQCYLLLKRSDEARRDFEAVVAADADSKFVGPARRHLATLAMQQGDYAGAAAGFGDWAQSADGDDAAEAAYQEATALAAAKSPEARKKFERFLKKFPESPRQQMARGSLALILSREGKCEDALKQIDAADSSQLDPAMKRSLSYERAYCLRTLGRNRKAIKAYQEVIAENGDDLLAAHGFVELAALEKDASDSDAAIELLDRFQSLAKKAKFDLPAALCENALYQLGVLYFNGKRFDLAAQSLGDFSKRFGKSELAPSAAYFEGESHFQAADFGRAADCFDRVIAADARGEEYGPALLRAGECRAQLQQWAKSEAAFELYLEHFADREQWHQAEFGRGWARENQGRHPEAIKAYRRVIERHEGPTAARAQFQIGQCFFAQKKLNEAVAELMKVDILYAYPDWSAAALYEAGRCFEQLNKTAEARRQFETVREKYSTTKWAEMAASRIETLAGSSLPGRT